MCEGRAVSNGDQTHGSSVFRDTVRCGLWSVVLAWAFVANVPAQFGSAILSLSIWGEVGWLAIATAGSASARVRVVCA